MGILDRLGLGRSKHDLLTSAQSLGVTSPYSPRIDIPAAIITDLFSDDAAAKLPLSREIAISVPAVSKARNLLVSTIAKFPLRALDTKGLIQNQPPFLYRTNSAVTPYERMAWTVDDMVFYGVSLWLAKRGAKDSSGRGAILDAEWCPRHLWSIVGGQVIVDGEPMPEDAVILFNSPFEGLLQVGQRTVTGAVDQEAAWVGRAKNPVPLIDLHRIDDQLTDEEVTEFVAAWAKARTSENGAIGSTPPSIEIKTYGEVKADLMTEGRNAIRTDVGSFLNVRASMLDGTSGIDSLTYTTKDGEKNSFYEFDLPFWTDPIEARLSMDDIVTSGQRVRFDKYEAYNLPTPTGPIQED
ncbi:hypothetical protein GCM10027056_00260 [Glaciibacter psychrotolerans]